jgi:hypothetical protein
MTSAVSVQLHRTLMLIRSGIQSSRHRQGEQDGRRMWPDRSHNGRGVWCCPMHTKTPEQLQCMPWLNSVNRSYRLDTHWNKPLASHRVTVEYHTYHTTIKHTNIWLPIFKFSRNNVLPHVTHDWRISPGKPRRNHNHLYTIRSTTGMIAFSSSCHSVKLEVSPTKEPTPNKKRTVK